MAMLDLPQRTCLNGRGRGGVHCKKRDADSPHCVMRSVRLALSLRVALNFLCNLHGVKGNTFFFFFNHKTKEVQSFL